VLRENIRREIESVTPDVLVKTFHNMERRVQACLDANGEHFQHLLWLRHVSHRPRYVCVKFH
jgi:hypothetical protein